jgi:amino acid adenylation domain-containing protein
VADLVAHPTVAELAAAVTTAPEPADPAPFALVSPQDRARLAGAQDAYPVTQLQLGLMYHSREHEVSAVYHDVFRYTMRMPWRAEAFRAAFDKLVARHPTLRSSFDLGGFAEPLQIVHHDAPGGLEIADLRGLDPAAAQADIEAHMHDRRYFRYAFEQAPLYLFRAHVLPSTVDIVFSFHHVILDGWSVASLVSELLRDYLHLAGADLDPVPDTALPSPAAYAVEERRTLASAEARRYWQAKLAGAEPTQIDGFRQYAPPEDADDLIVRLAPLPDGLTERVREFARGHRVPVKSVLLAAHCLTLRLFSGTGDVVTGLVTHGRPDVAEAGRIAGLFLNTVPLRITARPDTWLAMVHEVYRQEQECHPYRRYPLHAVQHDRGGAPVLETVFNYVHMHVLAPVLRVPGVELVGFEGLERTNFALLVNAVVHPVDGRIILRVDTDGRTFTTDQTDLLVDTYLRILRRITDEPRGEPDFAFLAEPGAAVLPSPEPPSDILARLAAHVAATPDAVAVATGTESWTYQRFDAVTDRIAAGLAGLGVGDGDLVGILLDRSPAMIAAIYGVAKAGAACVPLDATYPQERIAAMIELADPVRVVTQPEHAHAVTDPSLVLPVESLLSATGDTPKPEIRPETLLYVLFTSGSTGVPKGVAMPHRALDNYQAWQVNAASGAAGGVTLQFAPLSFDVSFQEIYTTISGGGTLQMVGEDQRREPAALLRLLDTEGVERVFLPYVALQQLAETAVALRIFPRTLRVVISSGEQLRVTAEIRRFMAGLPAGAVLENQYGPTETHLVTTYLMRGDPARFPNLPPIGTATTGVEMHLLDERMRPVPRGVLGELYFGGVQLAHGYHGQPELTRQRFVPNPYGPPGSRLYRTGDLARMLPGGDLIWVARKDTQAKIRGFRVEPLEVEIAIMKLAEEYPGIREAAVVVRRRGDTDAFLAAFLVGGEESVDLPSVKKRLRAALPAHMMPSVFGWLPAMPLTPSGKRDDAALRTAPLTPAAQDAEPVAPRDRYERSLAEILGDLLGQPTIGVHDDFFDIGGTSLTAMRLVVMLEQRYGVSVPLSTFVTAPTVAGLAELLRAGGAGFAFDPLVPIRAGGAGRPLFLVHPLGGNVLCYVGLAGRLPADRPVYGLQAAGCDAGSEPLRTVPELAASYLAAIRRVQPQGPYLVAGWSFGGTIAYEMARQLRAADPDGVERLILIDPVVRRPDVPAQVAEDTLLHWFFWELIWLAEGGRPRLEPIPALAASREAKLDFIADRAGAAGVLGGTRASVRRLYEVFLANWQAILDYRPPVEPQDLTLLRATEPLPDVLLPMHAVAGTLHEDPTNGWDRLSCGRLDILDVPGDHLVLMEEPYVAAVAEHITELLRDPA